MTIKVGDRLPQATFKVPTDDGPATRSTDDLFAGRRVALFAVPGAFTPTCSSTHLPGYEEHYASIKACGVDEIYCLSVNDAFVMSAWGKSQNAEELIMLADGNGVFTKAVGLELDATGFGMGIRSKRFAMIVDKGVVTHLAVEPAGGIVESAADAILAKL